MDTLKTKSGKTFSCDYFNPGITTRQCNIRLVDADITTVARVFSDPEETVQLWAANAYAAGYTRLAAIVPEGGIIRVVLEKE